MAEMFSLTSGPMQVSGNTFQPITLMADVLAYDMLSVVVRVQAADAVSKLSIYLYTSTQAQQDDFGSNPPAPDAGSSFVNVLAAGSGAIVSSASTPATVVLHIGVGCADGKFLRTLRWVSTGIGTFTIDVIGRRFH